MSILISKSVNINEAKNTAQDDLEFIMDYLGVSDDHSESMDTYIMSNQDVAQGSDQLFSTSKGMLGYYYKGYMRWMGNGGPNTPKYNELVADLMNAEPTTKVSGSKFRLSCGKLEGIKFVKVGKSGFLANSKDRKKLVSLVS